VVSIGVGRFFSLVLMYVVKDRKRRVAKCALHYKRSHFRRVFYLKFYCHNSQVTLMRTTAQENTQLGRWIGSKLNACAGEVCFVVPLGGFSTLDAPGQPFWDPQALGAFVHSLERTLVQTAKRRLLKVPYHINDPLFAAVIIEQFHAIAATAK
jgi:uncharacterized protein (UPF0261 family)